MIPPSDLSCLQLHQSLGPHHGLSRLKHRKQCNKWRFIRFGKNWGYFYSKWSRQLKFFITANFIYLLCQIWIDREITIFSLSQQQQQVLVRSMQWAVQKQRATGWLTKVCQPLLKTMLHFTGDICEERNAFSLTRDALGVFQDSLSVSCSLQW